MNVIYNTIDVEKGFSKLDMIRINEAYKFTKLNKYIQYKAAIIKSLSKYDAQAQLNALIEVAKKNAVPIITSTQAKTPTIRINNTSFSKIVMTAMDMVKNDLKK